MHQWVMTHIQIHVYRKQKQNNKKKKKLGEGKISWRDRQVELGSVDRGCAGI